MTFLFEYGLFLAKAITVVIAIAIIIGLVVSAKMKGGNLDDDGNIEIKKLNEKLDSVKKHFQEAVLEKDALKKLRKSEKSAEKQLAKTAKKQKSDDEVKKRLFVLDFDGDIKASAVEQMRQEISAVLSIATQQDEVLLRLESGGGMVHSYGLASSQLQRIRNQSIPLTVCIDKVAASGGYMMACVADKIIAAPFAIVGSIGVVAQLPNFHKLLKKHDVDYEILTAGDYKRTLTMFGENTDKGRAKFKEEIEDTHLLFKDFVKTNRNVVNIDEVATGEVWFGTRAAEHKLVDDIQTSDQYIIDAAEQADVYEIAYIQKKTLTDRIGLSMQVLVNRVTDIVNSKVQGL